MSKKQINDNAFGGNLMQSEAYLAPTMLSQSQIIVNGGDHDEYRICSFNVVYNAKSSLKELCIRLAITYQCCLQILKRNRQFVCFYLYIGSCPRCFGLVEVMFTRQAGNTTEVK